MRARNRVLYGATLIIAIAAALLLDTSPGKSAVPGYNGLIAFSSDRDGNFEIYTTAPSGADERRLTKNAANDLEPAWSPDGTTLAFVSDRDGDQDIFLIDANGSNLRQLTDVDGDDTDS